jgi:hypothetical protein
MSSVSKKPGQLKGIGTLISSTVLSSSETEKTGSVACKIQMVPIPLHLTNWQTHSLHISLIFSPPIIPPNPFPTSTPHLLHHQIPTIPSLLSLPMILPLITILTLNLPTFICWDKEILDNIKLRICIGMLGSGIPTLLLQ